LQAMKRILTVTCAVALGVVVLAQQRGQPPGPPLSPKAAAPIDLTGNWVAVVTEDWRWRMLMPRKGDYSSVPLSAEGKKIADTWDPGKLSSDGCKPYGAAGIMRVPGRLRVAWDNETTLRIDTDAGQQTRLLHFDKSPAPQSAGTWQGYSAAEWERIPQPGGLGVSSSSSPARTSNASPTRRNGCRRRASRARAPPARSWTKDARTKNQAQSTKN
jgi:hypothetical protein